MHEHFVRSTVVVRESRDRSSDGLWLFLELDGLDSEVADDVAVSRNHGCGMPILFSDATAEQRRRFADDFLYFHDHLRTVFILGIYAADIDEYPTCRCRHHWVECSTQMWVEFRFGAGYGRS